MHPRTKGTIGKWMYYRQTVYWRRGRRREFTCTVYRLIRTWPPGYF